MPSLARPHTNLTRQRVKTWTKDKAKKMILSLQEGRRNFARRSQFQYFNRSSSGTSWVKDTTWPVWRKKWNQSNTTAESRTGALILIRRCRKKTWWCIATNLLYQVRVMDLDKVNIWLMSLLLLCSISKNFLILLVLLVALVIKNSYVNKEALAVISLNH